MGKLNNFEFISAHMEDMSEQVYEDNRAKGFYEDAPASFADRIANEEWMNQRAVLIAGELSEAYEALRHGNLIPAQKGLADVERYATGIALPSIETWRSSVEMENLKALYKQAYEDCVKGTVEEELADTAIRMLDFIGAIGGWKFDNYTKDERLAKFGINKLFNLGIQRALKIADAKPKNITASVMDAAQYVCELADRFEIDLQDAVYKKLLYNTTRPYKHGKKF